MLLCRFGVESQKWLGCGLVWENWYPNVCFAPPNRDISRMIDFRILQMNNGLRRNEPPHFFFLFWTRCQFTVPRPQRILAGSTTNFIGRGKEPREKVSNPDQPRPCPNQKKHNSQMQQALQRNPLHGRTPRNRGSDFYLWEMWTCGSACVGCLSKDWIESYSIMYFIVSSRSQQHRIPWKQARKQGGNYGMGQPMSENNTYSAACT